MANGAEGGHVQSGPHKTSPTTDVSLAFLCSAITVVWSQASQGGGGLSIEFPQFRHFCQERGGDDWTDPWNGFETFGFMSQLEVTGDEFHDGLIAVLDLFFQQFEKLTTLP